MINTWINSFENIHIFNSIKKALYCHDINVNCT